MEFIQEIKILENTNNQKGDYFSCLGNTPVLLTALETTNKQLEDGTIIIAELFQKAIVRYVAAYTDSSYFIKLKDTLDYQKLGAYIEANNIKLVLNINQTHEKDLIIKPLKLGDVTIIKELEDALKEQNITNITIADYQLESTDLDVVNIYLPKENRDIDSKEKLGNTCEALISFIEMYTNYTGY